MMPRWELRYLNDFLPFLYMVSRKLLRRGLATVIGAAVATWAVSDLFLSWLLGIPQTPDITPEQHTYFNLGFFVVFAVHLLYWDIDF